MATWRKSKIRAFVLMLAAVLLLMGLSACDEEISGDDERMALFNRTDAPAVLQKDVVRNEQPAAEIIPADMRHHRAVLGVVVSSSPVFPPAENLLSRDAGAIEDDPPGSRIERYWHQTYARSASATNDRLMLLLRVSVPVATANLP